MDNDCSGGSYGDIKICNDHVLKEPRSTGSFPYFVREVLALQLLKQAKVPFIVQLLDIKDDTMVLKKYAGDLHDTQDTALKSTDDIIKMLYRMLVAMTNIHALHLCHRDIKPENILSSENGEDMCLCDFGLARYFPNAEYPEQCTTTVQTTFYRAPELLFETLLDDDGDYDIGPMNITNLDVWSLGMTALKLLDNEDLLPPDVNEGDLTLPELYGVIEQLYGEDGELSQHVYETTEHQGLYLLLSEMLTLNSTHRPSPEMLLSSNIFDHLRATEDIINAAKFTESRIDMLLNIIPEKESNPIIINHLQTIYDYEMYNNVETPRLAVAMVYLLDDTMRTQVDTLSIINLASIIMDHNLPEIDKEQLLKLLKVYNYDLLYPVNEIRVRSRLGTLHSHVLSA